MLSVNGPISHPKKFQEELKELTTLIEHFWECPLCPSGIFDGLLHPHLVSILRSRSGEKNIDGDCIKGRTLSETLRLAFGASADDEQVSCQTNPEDASAEHSEKSCDRSINGAIHSENGQEVEQLDDDKEKEGLEETEQAKEDETKLDNEDKEESEGEQVESVSEEREEEHLEEGYQELTDQTKRAPPKVYQQHHPVNPHFSTKALTSTVTTHAIHYKSPQSYQRTSPRDVRACNNNKFVELEGRLVRCFTTSREVRLVNLQDGTGHMTQVVLGAEFPYQEMVSTGLILVRGVVTRRPSQLKAFEYQVICHHWERSPNNRSPRTPPPASRGRSPIDHPSTRPFQTQKQRSKSQPRVASSRTQQPTGPPKSPGKRPKPAVRREPGYVSRPPPLVPDDAPREPRKLKKPTDFTPPTSYRREDTMSPVSLPPPLVPYDDPDPGRGNNQRGVGHSASNSRSSAVSTGSVDSFSLDYFPTVYLEGVWSYPHGSKITTWGTLFECGPTGGELVKGDCCVRLVLGEPQYRLEKKTVLVEGVVEDRNGSGDRRGAGTFAIRACHIEPLAPSLCMCLKFLASGNTKPPQRSPKTAASYPRLLNGVELRQHHGNMVIFRGSIEKINKQNRGSRCFGMVRFSDDTLCKINFVPVKFKYDNLNFGNQVVVIGKVDFDNVSLAPGTLPTVTVEHMQALPESISCNSASPAQAVPSNHTKGIIYEAIKNILLESLQQPAAAAADPWDFLNIS